MNNVRYNGKKVEAELFGQVKSNSDNQYQTYERALADVKQAKINNDPLNPVKDFAKLLRLKVANRLSPEDPSRVKFYTAINTPLDLKHGVDAVIEFTPVSSRAIRVTIDITMNPDKIDGHADIVFSVPTGGLPDYPKTVRDRYDKEDRDEFCKYVDSLAEEVCEHLKSEQVRSLLN